MNKVIKDGDFPKDVDSVCVEKERERERKREREREKERESETGVLHTLQPDFEHISVHRVFREDVDSVCVRKERKER